MNENANSSKSQSASFFKELGEFMNPYRFKYAASVVLSVIAVISHLASYGFAGAAVGVLFADERSYADIVPFVAMVIVCKILNAIMLNFSTWLSHRAAYHTLKDIRNALVQKMMKLPMGYFEENGSGRLKTLLVDRVESIEKTLAHLLPEMTANLLIPIGMAVLMFFIDWRLALCVLGWIVFGLAVSFGMMIGYEEKYAGQVAAAKGMSQSVVEYVGGIELIKNFNMADACYKKYEDAVYHNAKYSVDWIKETQVFMSLGMAIAPYSLFPVLIAGLIFLGNGTLEPSAFFLFMIFALGICGPVMRASAYFDQLAQMGTTAKEIRDVLDYPELKRGEESVDNLLPEIELSNITFSYDGGENKALKDISVKIPQKTMLALVGPSGSGKSTIAKLLAGYWDPTSGEILIGGKRMSDISQEELNKLIAYVDQETFLFDVSIMDNIRMGNPNATDEEVVNAAVRAGCDEFIRALPNGYQTQAGLAGKRLSGGERQRIAIARAIMKDSPILILDEATASSDPENEAAIQSALSAAAVDKTLIVVAHRLSTIISAEQIAFVKDGEIISLGTHSELLRTCPLYTQMWNLSENADKGGKYD